MAQQKKYKGYTLTVEGTSKLRRYIILNKGGEVIEKLWSPAEFECVVDSYLTMM